MKACHCTLHLTDPDACKSCAYQEYLPTSKQPLEYNDDRELPNIQDREQDK